MTTDSVSEDVRTLAGRYRVGRLLGRGGMSDVHEGTDIRLRRRVAVKLLRPELATDPAFRTRFRQEAQAAAKMTHPTIVRVYDAGEDTVLDDEGYERQQPFIVMEYVDGRLLKDILKDGALSPERATEIAKGVLTALEFSHRAGVIHRDIKPGNIMVTESGQVKVMDFGIARAISDSAATVAQTSAILGTAQYFSPEQARGESIDVRTDLYSMGVVLYEMLAGRPPFRGDTPVAVAYQHVSEAPTPPSSHRSGISPAYDAVVLHALAKDRDDRFQTAGEFRQDLEAAAAGELPRKREKVRTDTVSTLFGVNPALNSDDAAVRQIRAESDDRMRRVQSRPPAAWIWLGIVFAIVMVGALGIWLINLQAPNLAFAPNSVAVPDVVGQSYDEAAAELEQLGLSPERRTEPSDTVEQNQVVRVEPGVGVNVETGQTVNVYVSLGSDPVTVPPVAGLGEQQAIDALTAAGLAYEVEPTFSPTVGAGTVITSTPAGNNVTTRGDVVRLQVSNGQVELGNYVDQDLAAAQAALVALQFSPRLDPDWSCAGNIVTAQSLEPGPQPQRSEITLTYCADR
ncbi:Stk1 family PASTA domain-containing Ser/Thr kinase [Desertivibrio insolitus]|uniref:Stk1 family PASTA domain-containing Ser/Thr kinase n=1 Tax=Herbiconiux sp. SYSU D00978 TaxID=2812562 RepID=UPI001A95E609|nr:Stk1 family PASTA domain-containing Ser/Thr kinase [Herbiconiux sp. SYSU D00978]